MAARRGRMRLQRPRAAERLAAAPAQAVLGDAEPRGQELPALRQHAGLQQRRQVGGGCVFERARCLARLPPERARCSATKRRWLQGWGAATFSFASSGRAASRFCTSAPLSPSTPAGERGQTIVHMAECKGWRPARLARHPICWCPHPPCSWLVSTAVAAFCSGRERGGGGARKCWCRGGSTPAPAPCAAPVCALCVAAALPHARRSLLCCPGGEGPCVQAAG